MLLLYREDGFSLIELLVAFAILAVVVVSLSTIFTASYTSIYMGGEKSRALGLAQKIMEELKQKSPDQLSSLPLQEGVENGQRWQYRLETTTMMAAQKPIPGIKIEVFVYYQEPDKKVQLTSFIRG